MPNPIKYSTGSETLALKKGNLYIGTGAVGKGPSDTTGYYNGVSPSSGGYTIYMYKSGAPGNLSYHSAANDSQLISFTNNLAGQSYTGVNQCFNYYYGQTDKVLVNQDYPSDFPYIVMDGLVLYLDAGVSLSYSGSGTSWYDINGLGPKNNGTLTNGPTYSSANGGSIVFDGVDDYVYLGNPPSLQFGNSFSFGCWFYWANVNTLAVLMGKRNGGDSGYNQYGMNIAETVCCGPAGKKLGVCLISDKTSGGGNCSFNCGISATLPNSEGWVYGICTVSQYEQKLYINGTLAAESNDVLTNCTFNVPNRSFYVGCTGGETEGTIIIPFNNKIAVAQAYNKTLSASEVLQNYNAQKGRFGL